MEDFISRYGFLFVTVIQQALLGLSLYFPLMAGQLSLASIGFYALGGYVAAIVGTHPDLAPLRDSLGYLIYPLEWLTALVISVLLGLGLGFPALRLRGIYLALATFAFGEAMQWVFLNWESVTNGSNGLQMKPASLGGYQLMNDLQAYPFVIAIAALMLWLTVTLSRSRLGSSFRAVRESDVAAVAMGVNTRTVKVTAFVLSAAFAGVAGGMYTLFTSFIHPESLGFQTTILILTMVVVGGLGSVRGAVAGAIVFGLASELLRQAPSYQEIIYGGILMLFMMFLPKGMASLFAARRKSQRAASVKVVEKHA